MKPNSVNTFGTELASRNATRSTARSISLSALLILGLAGCGGEEQVEAASEANASTAPHNSASASTAPAKLALASDAIDRADFLGLNPPKVMEPEPCPFLSEETALKTAKRTDKLVRRNTSNSECYWSRNLGFSIKVRVDP
ncbi:MAG: hypothetical protein AB8C02_11205, partial [Halioglobus sp.]